MKNIFKRDVGRRGVSCDASYAAVFATSEASVVRQFNST